MTGAQHKTMGYAASAALAANILISGSGTDLLWSVPGLMIGVMLPDIDSDTSKIGSKRKRITSLTKKLIFAALISLGCYIFGTQGVVRFAFYVGIVLFALFVLTMISKNRYVNKQLGFMLEHRGLMHTLLPPAFIVASTLLNIGLPYTLFCYGAAVGYVIHLIGDCATISGAPILWPISQHNFRYLKLSSSKHMPAMYLVCYAYCVLFIVIGVTLGMR